jgi:uncharacterized protein
MPAEASAAADLRASFEELRGVDQHAHLLSGPGREWSLVDLLSESAESGQRAQTRHHPTHRRALRDLGEVLGVEADEDSVVAARRDAGYEEHTRHLLDAGRFEAMLVDDGFPVADALDLQTQATLAGCPVYHILRIETAVEQVARHWPAFTVVRARFREAVAEALDGGTAALKTIAAYRCGLDLPRPEFSDAEQAYGAWRRASPGEGAWTRLAHPALIAFFLSEALAVARDRRPVPLQVHTGLGDADLALQRADPALLGPVIAEAAAARVPVVLLHCYPFVRQAAWLASIHGHVFVDLSLALLLAGHRGAEIILDALDLAPASKVLFATDASRSAEMFFLAARWWRDALAGALGRLVAEDAIDAATARRWGKWILTGNARRLYSL